MRDAACPKEGKGKMTVFVVVYRIFLFGDAARSRGRSVFEFQLSDAKRRIVHTFELPYDVVARTTLSDSRCYGYVLSLPRAIFISHIHEKSVTEFCEIRVP